MKRLERPRRLIAVTLAMIAVLSPVPGFSQSLEVPTRSLSINAGLHAGDVGGKSTYGPVVSVIGWQRTSASVALRLDLSYGYNSRRLLVACWDDCPTTGTMSRMTAIGAGMMVGRLSSPVTRYYMVVGGEVLGMRALHSTGGGVMGVPKLGAGAVFVKESVLAEFSLRWRNWRDRPLRQWAFVLGWHR